MSRLKIWQTTVVLLVLVNTAMLALLWFSHKAEKKLIPAANVKDFLIKELALNEQQKKQFEALRSVHFATVQKINKQTKDLRDRFFENISKTETDSALILSLAKQISEKEAMKEQTTLYHFRQLRGILTSGQQQKFDSVIKEVLQRMGRPPGPPGRGGPPLGHGQYHNPSPGGPPPPGQ